jgi:hypothetical protein
MNTQPNFDFQWLSSLGVSVILFSLFGLLSLVVGLMIPFLFRKIDDLPAGILFFSQRTDSELLGRPTSDLIQEDSALAKLRFLYTYWLAGLCVAFGIFQLALTWFGLRNGQAWALWTLTLADLALLPYYVRTLRVYTGRGISLRLGDLPPLYSLLVLIPIAAVLGWFGLRALGVL